MLAPLDGSVATLPPGHVAIQVPDVPRTQRVAVIRMRARANPGVWPSRPVRQVVPRLESRPSPRAELVVTESGGSELVFRELVFVRCEVVALARCQAPPPTQGTGTRRGSPLVRRERQRQRIQRDVIR